jgi:RNA polymerase sigma-70 factor (ECF subfamily)
MQNEANMISDIFFSKLQNGEKTAQRQLYESYAKAMYNVCLRITGDTDDAQDALQDAFVKIFRSITSFDKPTLLPAWIKKITVNTAINLLQKKKRQKALKDELQNDFENESNENNADNFDDQLLKVDAVKKAIQLLPDGYRVVFSLYVLEGYDHTEIAEILDIAVSTSKTQLSRARLKILSILKNAKI